MAKPTKMNQHLRELARDALLRHAALDKAKTLHKEERALFDAVYALAMPEKELKALQELDQKWLTHSSRMLVNANGWELRLCRLEPEATNVYHYDYGRGHVETRVSCNQSETVIVPRYASYGWDLRHDLTLPAELAQRLQIWAQDERLFKEKVSEIGAQIRASVNGFATLESLLEAVPELVTIEPELLKKPEKKQAVVPSVQGLMCQIAGLRGEEREGCAELAQAA